MRRFHAGGGWHADLNATNVLVPETGDARLVDLDKARFCHQPVQGAAAVRNLLRMRRSLQKLGQPGDAWQVLLAGYGGSEVPAWLERLYAARGHASDALAGRRTT